MFKFCGALAGALLGLVLCAPVHAQPKPFAPTLVQAAAVTEATSLLKDANAVFRTKPTDLTEKVPALEAALRNRPVAVADDASPVILYDGMAEQIMVQLWLKMPEAQAVAARSPKIAADPYPHIAYLLGFYYNEIQLPDRAIEAMQAGLDELKTHMEWQLTDMAPRLLSEIGAAHNIARRWQAAYDAYGETLTIAKDSAAPVRAAAYRGQGFALIELNRLDLAETAYKTALKLEPDNALSQRELAYIAELRSGGARQTPSTMVTGGAPAP